MTFFSCKKASLLDYYLIVMRKYIFLYHINQYSNALNGKTSNILLIDKMVLQESERYTIISNMILLENCPIKNKM